MALAVDANVNAMGTLLSGTVTSPSFSTISANELLLAFISSDNATGTGSPTMSVSGAGLTWVEVVGAGTNADAVGAQVRVYRAFSTTTLSSVTVTATSSDNLSDVFVNVVSFTGVDTTGSNGSGAVGATGTATGSGTAVTKSITTTRNGSWVWAVGDDPQSNPSVTAGSNQTVNAKQVDNTNLNVHWSQKQNATTPTSGTSVTMNATLGASNVWEWGVIEILPALATTNHFLNLLGVGT